MTATSDYSATGVRTTTPTPVVETLDSDVPSIETAAHGRTLPRITRCRDVYQGSEAIREGGETYLPKFAGESDTLYDARRTIAALFNGYARTVLASVGLLCEPEPVLADDMPAILVAMWENVTGDGMHGAVLGRHLVTAAMVDGFAGLLTEYPRADDPRIDRSKASFAATVALETGAELDAADVEALGLRPYFILVKVDDCLPVYETVNGRRTLVLFIRRETATERKGRFGLESRTRYRVYELQKDGAVTYERWSVAVGGGRPTKDEGPTVMRNLTGIPWSPLVAGEKLGEHEYKPTLLDLADLTLTHHRIATGILSLEEQAFVPTLVIVGRRPNEDGDYDPVLTGAGNTIEIPATDGMPATPAYYLSPPVSVLEPGMQSLENCKAEMGAMGASFLAPEPRAQETATAHKMDASAERATIGTVSRGFKDCLESAFGFAGQYVKQRAGSVKVNDDFTGEGIDPVLATMMVSAYQSGIFTLQEVRHFLSTGQLPEGFDADDIAAVLRQHAPPQTTDGNGEPLPDGSPPGGKRPTKATIRNTKTGDTHTIETE